MSVAENKELVRAYLEALSGKPKPDAVVDRFVAEEPLKDHIRAAEEGLPLYELISEQMIGEDDLVHFHGRLRGVHTGTFSGIPATGRSFDIPIFITYRIADGKIVDHWMLTDNLAMMQQLGVIPETAGA